MSSLALQVFGEPASPRVQDLCASLFLLHVIAAHILELTPRSKACDTGFGSVTV